MASEDAGIRRITILRKLACDLRACLQVADESGEHVIAANLAYALSLVEDRLAAHRPP